MVLARGNGRNNENAENFCDNRELILSQVPQEIRDMASESIMNDLINEVILEVSFEVHRSMKSGLLFVEQGIEDDEKYAQVNIEGLDIFGQAPGKKQQDCECPTCKRSMNACRFAPHLEKCMGMGRNSSRIASRRIQNSTRESSNHMGQASDDDDEDDDWVERKKRKRDKNSPRRTKLSKIKLENCGSNGSMMGSNASVALLAGSSLQERRHFFSQICGVVSEHTGKMCTRSVRCPQHSNEQKRGVRDHYIPDDVARPESTTGSAKYLVDSEDMQLDNDGFDHWDHDLSNTTSPADSTSTNNSSSTTTSTSSHTKRSSSNSSSRSTKKKSSKKRRDFND